MRRRLGLYGRRARARTTDLFTMTYGQSSTTPHSSQSNAATVLNSPWAYRNFRLFLVSMIAVILANQITGTVVAYQIYKLTQDPLSLGMIGLAEALPFISLSLFGGHFADVYDRRSLAITVLCVLSVSACALWALTVEQHTIDSATLRWSIYGIVMLGGCCRAFLGPARAALNAELIPVALYARAIAFRTGAFQLSMALGPALGGLLYASVGPAGAYLASGGLLLTAILTMQRISSVRPNGVTTRASLPVLQSVKEGVSFLASDRLLLSVQLLDLFAVLFGGATALLPVFANEILRVGSEGFGLLRAAPAVGAISASLVLAVLPPLSHAGRAILLAVAGYGVSIILFGLSRNFVFSLLLLGVGGALDMVSVLVRSTLLQLRAPSHMLGRLSSINQIFIGSSNEIGAFESGVAAKLLGVVPSVLFGGAMTLLTTCLTALKAPELRRLGPLTADADAR
jgi:MFS family permease